MKKILAAALCLCTAISVCSCGMPKKSNLKNSAKNVQSSSFDYTKHLGVWYYTSCTDYSNITVPQIEIKDLGSNKAVIYNWSEEDDPLFHGKLNIMFVTSDMAESNDFYTEDGQHIKYVFTFDTRPDRPESFWRDTVDADNGNIVAQTSGGYRYISDFYSGDAAEPEGNADMRSEKYEEFQRRASEIRKYDETHYKTAVTQADLNAESYKVYQKWDALLNDIYTYLKQTMDSASFQKLQADEVNWIKEKEQGIKAAAAEWEGGSGEAMARNTAGSKYTEERCEYLMSLTKQ